MDHALLGGVRLAPRAVTAGLSTWVAAAPAGAQQTPATYCASLPAVSCEVLNVELLGPSSGVNTTVNTIVGLIKQCRNRNFETRLVYLNLSGGAPLSVVIFNGTNTQSSGGSGAATIAGLTTGRTSIAGSPVMDLAMNCW